MSTLLFLGLFGIFCLQQAHSLSCSGSKPHKLQFNIKFDRWAEEVSWGILDSSNKLMLYGNGTGAADFAEVEDSVCVKSGCYTLEINDTYGDGIYSYGYFGWYKLKLDDAYVTLGEQTFDGSQTDLYFCTQLFDSTSGSQIGLEFETFDYNSDIYIVGSDESDYEIYYLNQYEFPDYFNSSVFNTLYLTNARASTSYCYKVMMDDSYVDTSAGYYSINVELDENTLYHHDQNTGSVVDLDFDLCLNSSFTSAPTPEPTFGPPDVQFYVGNDGRFKASAYLGCPGGAYSGSACADTKTWKIDGECDNPRLTLSVFQSDYDWETEQASIFINDEYFAFCEPLNDECTYEWQTCNLTDSMDLTDYLFTDDDGTSYIDVGIACSSDVNICGIGMNDTAGLENGWYYCLARADISCDVWDGAQTPAPTLEPTRRRPTEDKYNLTVVLEFDATPEDLFWVLWDAYAGEYLWNDTGDAAKYQAYDTYTYSTTIEYGCYYLIILNATEYIEDTSPQFYGYYAVDLNSLRITHGKEAIGPAYNDTYPIFGVFEFCTPFTDVPPYGASGHDRRTFVPENSIEIKTYNFDGEIIFVDNNADSDLSGELVWATIYYNAVESEFHDSEVTNIIPVAHGCYIVLFYSYVWANNDYWYSMTLTDLNNTIISKVDSEDGFYSYVDFCTNDTGSDKAVLYENKYTLEYCNDQEDRVIPIEFAVKFDDWPEEVSWKVTGTDDLTGSRITYLYGIGNKSEEFEDLYHPTCVPKGCYLLQIFDAYGDGMTHQYDDYGWYRFYVDDREITLGKQAVENDGGSLYFCTTIFDGARNNVTITLEPEEDTYDHTNFSIYGGNNAKTLEYKNNYIVPGFESSVKDFVDTNTLFVTMGCYKLISNNYFTAEIVGTSDEMVAEKNEDSANKYETEMCGVEFDCLDGCSGGHGSNGGGSSSTGTNNLTLILALVLSGVGVGGIAVTLIILKWKKLACFKPGGKYDEVDEEVEM